jgi:predicted metal-dependent peptidase
MNLMFSSKFLNELSQKEVNFVLLHEDFHLLFNHPKRTITGQYDPKLANVAQDMIINHIIWEDIPHSFVEIPKDKNGKNMALFVPKEYTGKLIFEELYEWLNEEKEKWKKNKNNDKEGDESISEPYGPYGKNPLDENKPIDTWSKEQIFQDMENGSGEYLDKHISDDVPEDMRESIVKDIVEGLNARGLSSGNIESTINKLRKKRKDYLKELKRAVSNIVFGAVKQKTILKPNRRQISGLKGNKKIKTKINCILDTSGSMGGTFERVLEYVYRSDIEINLIETDTEVKWIQKIKNKRKLETLKIYGLGGTILMPAIDLIVEKFNSFNTVILTDGYCDSLDLSRLKGKVLIISTGVKVPILKHNKRVKQILIEKQD